MITVKFSGSLAEFIKKQEEQLEAATLKEVLKYIKRTYGKEAFKAAKRSQIAVNGRRAGASNGFGTKLADGDTVIFFPVCGGG